MTILIENFFLDAIIGILEKEKHAKQKVEISLSIDYKFLNNCFIDYAKITQLIIKYFENNKPELIENAINDICNILHKEFTQIEKIEITIYKLDILAPIKVGVKEIKVFNQKN